jgi:hypothetical protein
MVPTSEIRDRAWSLARGAAGAVTSAGHFAAEQATGALHRLRGESPKPDMDDTTLARKVETVIFRDAGAPKGSVDVLVVDGVVELRGEVKTPAQVRKLEAQARAVPEVVDVTNLLHLPKTPARTGGRKPGGKRATPRTGRTRVTAETTPPAAEPGPGTGGRRPAPLGSTGNGTGSGGTAPPEGQAG